MIPSYARYIEPFFGGGALFFHLEPRHAIINDRSESLMNFYSLIKNRDQELYNLLLLYHSGFSGLLNLCEKHYADIFSLYLKSSDAKKLETEARQFVENLAGSGDKSFYHALVLNIDEYLAYLCKFSTDKINRTKAHNQKHPFNDADLKENLVTGFLSGFYMYFRKVLNDMELKRISLLSSAYKAANFYFIREYCYGSMFRYNALGEFNIPYGGVTYNKKNFLSKIQTLFDDKTAALFLNTDITCMDFENFLGRAKIKEDDFLFLDPPYDTDFSDYEGAPFTRQDQIRLASCLKKTKAKFILVIKNTDFIYSLYKDSFKIISFDNQYTCNVRSRNERSAEHLVIMNF